MKFVATGGFVQFLSDVFLGKCGIIFAEIYYSLIYFGSLHSPSFIFSEIVEIEVNNRDLHF